MLSSGLRNEIFIEASSYMVIYTRIPDIYPAGQLLVQLWSKIWYFGLKIEPKSNRTDSYTWFLCSILLHPCSMFSICSTFCPFLVGDILTLVKGDFTTLG